MLTKQKKEEIQEKWIDFEKQYRSYSISQMFDFWLSLLSQELEGKVDVEEEGRTLEERVKRIEDWIDFWETIETGWRPSLTSDKKEKI